VGFRFRHVGSSVQLFVGDFHLNAASCGTSETRGYAIKYTVHVYTRPRRIRTTVMVYTAAHVVHGILCIDAERVRKQWNGATRANRVGARGKKDSRKGGRGKGAREEGSRIRNEKHNRRAIIRIGFPGTGGGAGRGNTSAKDDRKEW
jgi:hypothetical protein